MQSLVVQRWKIKAQRHNMTLQKSIATQAQKSRLLDQNVLEGDTPLLPLLNLLSGNLILNFGCPDTY